MKCVPSFLNDISVQAINRLPARADFLPKGRCLDGEWAFQYYDSPLYAPAESVLPETDDADWPRIRVPLSWEFAGYGQAQYVDLLYPFPLDPPNIPTLNPTGIYRTQFDYDGEAWPFLRFEGVESAFELFVNGEFVGASKGSFMPAEFDIARHVQRGANRMAVRVYRYSDRSYMEDQDMWRLSGIFRSVWLLLRPRTHFADVEIEADYDAQSGEGVLRVNSTLRGEVGDETIRWCLRDAEAGSAWMNGDMGAASIPAVRPWTAETPNLYGLTVELLRGETVLETLAFDVGFRRIEICCGELRLNGKRLLLRGVNRHEFHTEKGRAIDIEDIRADIVRIKSMGLNAVRTAHYPNQSAFYALCDSLGLYVIDEADIETHGFEPFGLDGAQSDDVRWRDAYLDHVERMVRRDRNHACVVIWSLGNESGYGENFAQLYRWIKENEPTRPVHYEGDTHLRSVDVSSSMYGTLDTLRAQDAKPVPMPHILCEFGHAMGNGPGGLREYFELLENARRIQGWFLWEWRDHGIRRRRADGRTEYAYGGDFGDFPNNGNFVLDGLLFSDGTPSPGFAEYAHFNQPVWISDFDGRTVLVRNRYTFLAFGAGDAALEVRFDVEGALSEPVRVPLPALAPGESARVAIPRPSERTGDSWIDVCAVYGKATAWSPAQARVGRARFVWSQAEPGTVVTAGRLALSQQRGILRIEGGNLRATLDMARGELFELEAGGVSVLTEPPRISLWRAPIDNDMYAAPRWREAHVHHMQTQVRDIEQWETLQGACVMMRLYVAPPSMNWGLRVQQRYELLHTGAVCISTQGDFVGKPPEDLPRLGLALRVPKAFERVIYRGEGPGECYVDSRDAALDGIWDMATRDLSVAYEKPQENGNRTRTHWAVLYGDTGGLALGASRPVDFAARGVTDAQLEAARHHADLPEPGDWVVHMDYCNAGLGSNSCGPGRFAPYRVPVVPFAYTVCLLPVSRVDSPEAARRKGREAQALALYAARAQSHSARTEA